MDRLMIVSADSHAIAPPESWKNYVEARYHTYLPQLEEENRVFTACMVPLNGYVQEQTEAYDFDRAYRSGGVAGLWDADTRIREMDREGIAAEVVYPGDPRAADLFHAPLSQAYPLEVCDAGTRAYHRWAHDTFGRNRDRILLVGVTGTCTDMAATLAELEWIADHGFVGTFVPGNTIFPRMRPLSDTSYDPFWARCEALGLAVVVHAGYGIDQGSLFPEIERITNSVAERGGSDIDLLMEITTDVFTPEFFSDVRPRRPLWQLTLGGVFDRFPQLKLFLAEIRADWMPATLQHLDRVFEARRGELPAKQRPSEYWHSNGLTSLSFVHRCEVAMRYEIDLDTLAFGRDYPHGEGTWPNTTAWLVDALGNLPEKESRQILGENIVRFLGLDGAHLQKVADRVGPGAAEIIGKTSDLSPELLAHFDLRGGYLKEAEGGQKLSTVDAMVQEDLARVAS